MRWIMRDRLRLPDRWWDEPTERHGPCNGSPQAKYPLPPLDRDRVRPYLVENGLQGRAKSLGARFRFETK